MSRLAEILARVARRELAPAEAAELLAPERDLGFAKLDLDRRWRCGEAEIVFGEGKTPAQAAAIAQELHARSGRVLLTRVGPDHHAAVAAVVPEAIWHAPARCVTTGNGAAAPLGRVALLTGGTADLPVAEEARLTAGFCGLEIELFADVGVAGLHRLLSRLDAIRAADVVVVAAGMDGALPSVVAGLVDRPVIAVPTSAGYGASFGGLAALLTMLNACAAGVAVVNIDNGFGAGYLAATICRARIAASRPSQ